MRVLINIVVTDCNMPGLSGLDVARELAAICPALPVVLISGYVTPLLQADASRAGVRGLVPKQNLVEELPEEIHRLL